MSCAHSIGKPGVPAPMIKRDVRFAPILTVPLTIQIKKCMKPTMMHGTLFDELLFFQIKNLMKSKPAGRPAPVAKEPVAKEPAGSKAAPPLSRTPFADLMLHPEKLAAALRAAKRENDAFAASRVFSREPGDLAPTGVLEQAA